MKEVDCFVIYDDVSYIKGGWINRNRLLINGEPSYITIPLKNPSPNKFICETSISENSMWRNKLLKKIETTYSRSPYFKTILPVIESVIMHPTTSLSEFLVNQLKLLSFFMGIEVRFIISGQKYRDSKLYGQERILEICKIERATTYINLPGGQSLYKKSDFHKIGIDLKFIVPNQIIYKQRSSEFLPFLSIVDELMSVGPVEIGRHLNNFDFG